jgi:hypothetical protein
VVAAVRDENVTRRRGDSCIVLRVVPHASTRTAFALRVPDRRAVVRNLTRIMLQVAYDPKGVGDALGAAKLRIKGDLERFKAFIESEGRETGAWRGEIRDHR